MKKLFIKISRLLGFEIIDQNNFYSPTLKKELNDDLSSFNKKSIILPLGEVKITRKISSVLIVLRMNTDIGIWDQNKKRLFEEPKVEYSARSIKSLLSSIEYCQDKYPNLKIKTIIIDDNSSEKNLNRIKELIKKKDVEIVSLNHKEYEQIIKKQKKQETFSNLASLLKSFEIGKKSGEDLIFFVEDDYLHFESMLHD